MLLRIGEQEQNAPLSKICLQFFFFIYLFFFWRREKIQFGRFLSFAGHATPICTAEKNEKEITYGGIFWGLSLVLFYGTCVNATERDVLPTITTATTAVVVEEGKKRRRRKRTTGHIHKQIIICLDFRSLKGSRETLLLVPSATLDTDAITTFPTRR